MEIEDGRRGTMAEYFGTTDKPEEQAALHHFGAGKSRIEGGRGLIKILLDGCKDQEPLKSSGDIFMCQSSNKSSVYFYRRRFKVINS